MAALVGLGALVALEYRQMQAAKTRTASIRGRWLAWHPSTRDLVVVRIIEPSAAAPLPAGIVAAHEVFHGAAPSAAARVEWEPRPRWDDLEWLGDLLAVTYAVPKGTPSPVKGRSRYRHAFGDFGGGRIETGRTFLPSLYRSAAGDWWIRRRRANAYTVDRWIVG